MKKTLSGVAGGMLSAALLAGLGLPLVAAAFVFAGLVLGVICWIIGNAARSDRVTRMILARSGNASCLASAPPAPVPSQRRRAVTTRGPDLAPDGASPANFGPPVKLGVGEF